jgi:hypothetical protein
MSWNDFFVAVIGGIVATAIWTLVWSVLVWDRRRRRLRRDFHRLAGEYEVTEKFAASPEPYTALVTVRRNVLHVRWNNARPTESVIGEIVMDEQIPKSGRGRYHQEFKGSEYWGFWDLQVEDDSLLVHTTYADPQARMVFAAYVWRPLRRAALGG